ncbi:MAG: hypothetical protein ACO1N9_03910 [Flavobacterium sp.]
MKVFILFIVLLLLAPLQAQKVVKNTDFRFSAKVKTVQINEAGDKIEYQFDKQGRLIKYLSNTSIVAQKRKIYFGELYSYDSNGRLVETKNIYDGKIMSVEKFIYNAEKIIRSEKIENGIVTGYKEYKYENDTLAQVLEMINGNFYKNIILYDTLQNLTETRIYVNEALDWIKKIYNKPQQITEENYSVDYRGKVHFSSRKQDIYDDNQNVIKTIYEENGELKEADYEEVNTYENDFISNTKYYKRGILNSELFFDEKGNLTLEKRYDYQDEFKTENKYNNRGDLISVKHSDRNYSMIIKYEYWN